MPKRVSPEIWSLELEMEEFYLESSSLAGRRLTARDCVAGQTVAALNRSSAFNRARILQTFSGPGLVKVLYVDHGTKALLAQSSLFRLEPQFCRVPEQVVRVTRRDAMQPGLVFYNRREGEKVSAVQSKKMEEIKTEIAKFIFGLVQDVNIRNE